jgi:hypothetical protein
MNPLGVKQHSIVKGLGVKHKSIPHTLGNKGISQISNIITPNKPIVEMKGLGQNNLIGNKSNSSSLQYLPTGIKSKLEKK